jgi:hypothetical protein
MKAVIAPMVKTPAALAAASSLRPPVAAGAGLGVEVKLEATELTELATEDKEEREEERSLDPDAIGEVNVGWPLKESVAGNDDVIEGRGGIELGTSKQDSVLPATTTTGPVVLATPLASERVSTISVPGAIVTAPQRVEVPLTPGMAARTAPSTVRLRQARSNGATPPVVSYTITRGSQVTTDPALQDRQR